MLTVTSSLTRDSSRLRNDLIAASPIGFYNFKRECPLGKSDHPLEVLQRWGSGRLILKYTVLSTNGELWKYSRDLRNEKWYEGARSLRGNVYEDPV
ncbi:unnamed protein product [Callosobruchus maculatus]|uniref:Uncharacterized protein n=1 Tax=Callosobruchus maculatus TaxID=64391 RepID=A0A653DP71_CALMS|nr:unnamed protein product [Callosobruchus maculatus]